MKTEFTKKMLCVLNESLKIFLSETNFNKSPNFFLPLFSETKMSKILLSGVTNKTLKQFVMVKSHGCSLSASRCKPKQPNNQRTGMEIPKIFCMES